MALTRTTMDEESVEVALTPAEAYRRVLATIEAWGKVRSSQEQFGRITGKMRGTKIVLGPAATEVTVKVSGVDDRRTRVEIYATAQEGLVSQGYGAKAITRILDALAAPEA